MMGVLDNVEDKRLKENIIAILLKIEVSLLTQDIEACQVGKSKNNSKKN